MQNHEYYPYIMHAAKICAINYANGKNLQVDTTRRSHPPTVNRIYQQLSGAAHLFVARIPLAHRPRPARSYQPAHNR